MSAADRQEAGAAPLEPAQAAARIAAGGLLAYPTETVWGLGADARSAEAVERLRRWKGRDERHPLSILVRDVDALKPLGFELEGAASAAYKLAASHWPGPLTLVLPCRPGVFAPGVARADGAVGVRCSPHPVARAVAAALLALGAGPMTATSLNRSGSPPAGRRIEAEALCGAGALDRPLAAAGPDAAGAEPSTVVDLTGARPVLLRPGALAAAALGIDVDERSA